MSRSSLDVLSGADAIAEYLYGEATPYTVRRCRHLISKGLIPTRKVAGRVESRRAWLEKVWAAPDQPDAAA